MSTEENYNFQAIVKLYNDNKKDPNLFLDIIGSAPIKGEYRGSMVHVPVMLEILISNPEMVYDPVHRAFGNAEDMTDFLKELKEKDEPEKHWTINKNLAQFGTLLKQYNEWFSKTFSAGSGKGTGKFNTLIKSNVGSAIPEISRQESATGSKSKRSTSTAASKKSTGATGGSNRTLTTLRNKIFGNDATVNYDHPLEVTNLDDKAAGSAAKKKRPVGSTRFSYIILNEDAQKDEENGSIPVYTSANDDKINTALQGLINLQNLLGDEFEKEWPGELDKLIALAKKKAGKAGGKTATVPARGRSKAPPKKEEVSEEEDEEDEEDEEEDEEEESQEETPKTTPVRTPARGPARVPVSESTPRKVSKEDQEAELTTRKSRVRGVAKPAPSAPEEAKKEE